MSRSRPSSAGRQGLLITSLSQNKQAPKWSFGGRPSADGGRPGTPGPGSYQHQARNPRSPSFGFGTSTRESLRAQTSPGPGAYGAPQHRRPRSAGPGFGHSRRGVGNGASTPGPGAYTPKSNITRYDAPKVTCTPRRDGSAAYAGVAFGTPGPGAYLAPGQGIGPVQKMAPRWGTQGPRKERK
eukprot:TRINITY_DN32539_c0_g1_i2.p1 TRINITY_DN32539_c0_g1~~TRINITY_DN32539_c0_g1_i2.p1  ORF type:complete len:183 (+),score=5.63 TRINITY_DN32539_c0_g1_i2:69-617(+)